PRGESHWSARAGGRRCTRPAVHWPRSVPPRSRKVLRAAASATALRCHVRRSRCRRREIARRFGLDTGVYSTYRLINQSVNRTLSKNRAPTFAALAEPPTRAIRARLAEGEVSATDLAAPFEISLPAISKHLKVLERAGLIIRGRDAQWRPCRLDARPLQEV